MGQVRKLEVLQLTDTDSSEEVAGEDQEGDALSVGASSVKGDPLRAGPQIG